MGELNEHHRRHLVTTFKYVDELLSRTLHAVNAGDSSFTAYIPDLRPVQYKVLEDQLRELRVRMAGVLKRAGIVLPAPDISAAWGFRTAIVSARIEFEQIRPSHLRGYGEVTGRDAWELDQAASELLDQLDRMEAYLVQPQTADLEARVHQLGGAVGNRLEPLLTVLARVIGKRGLTHFRLPLAALLDRAGRSDLEVGLFGRVSSGKSSLLDYLLQTDLLPVGVTPVTAFPTRIRYGPTAQVRVKFVDQQEQVVAADHLVDFVSEQHNVDNKRHVLRVTLELPSPRLKEGILFVDTPGLGSLARRGAAETLAYLPHCDLGLVLVDSASTLLPEDVRLVDALLKAGAEVMVLLTKADMLSPEDRPMVLEYAKRQLREQLGVELPAHLISVRGHDARLCDQWASRVLATRQSAHQHYADESFARKTEILYESTLAALRGRLRDDEKRSAPPETEQSVEAEFRDLTGELEMLRRRSVNDLTQVEAVTKTILNGAVAELAATGIEEGRVNTAIQRAFSETLLAVGMELRQCLEETRSRIIATARQATQASREDDDVPAVTGMPPPPEWSPHIGVPLHLGLQKLRAQAAKQRTIRRQFGDTVEHEVQQAAREYLDRLEAWRMEILKGLRRAFQSRSDLYAGKMGTSDGAVTRNDPQHLHKDIDELLGFHDAIFNHAARDETGAALGMAPGIMSREGHLHG